MKKTGRIVNVTRRLVATMFSLSMVILLASTSQALDCTKCHGVAGVDAHPVDTPSGSLATYRNITTGAIKGNHNTHSTAALTGDVCGRCHGSASAPTSGYLSNHAILSNYSIRMNSAVGYQNVSGVVMQKNSFIQKSSPKLGTCTTVDCHFENRTPTWGSDIGLPSITSCGTCHEALPTTKSHNLHVVEQGNDLTACTKCHSDHSVEAAPFQHATSVGKRPITIKGSLTYGGTGTNYLPSQSGDRVLDPASCASASCHNDGKNHQMDTPNWGESVPRCSACHEAAPSTGSHTPHVTNPTATCGTCHNGAVQASTPPTTHNNGTVEVNASLKYGGVLNITTKPMGSAYYNCTNAYCHLNPTPTDFNGGAGTIQTTAVWGDPDVGRCTSCHTAVPTTGSHTKHAEFSVKCERCHPGAIAVNDSRVSSDPPTAMVALPLSHSNGKIDVYQTTKGDMGGGYSSNTGKAINTAYATCANAYCHSNARGTAKETSVWGVTVTSGCGTCHESTPTTGSHTAHITTGLDCSACHNGAIVDAVPPTSHLNNQIDVYKTTVGDLGYTVSGHAPAPNNYSACTAAYCHGGTNSPTWGANYSVDHQCTKCHGVLTVIANYSGASVGDNKYKQSAPGYGGVGLRLSRASYTVTGNVSTDAKVGAHDTHLRSLNNLGKPSNCDDCHKVPSTAYISGHMDGSSLPTFSNMVNNNETYLNSAIPYTHGSGSLNATYNNVNGTCSNTYCHGSALPGGTNTNPSWTDGTYLTGNRTVDCANCHGYPPETSTRFPHTPASAFMTCTGCHPHNGSRNATDALAGYDFHMNGNLEANKYCNSCHDFDVRGNATTGYVWGKATINVESAGAHAVHINYLKKRQNVSTMDSNNTIFGNENFEVICGTCHTFRQNLHRQTDRVDPTRHINFGDSSLLRQFGPNPPTYNGVPGTSSAANSGANPKTCKNVDCHFKQSPIWQPY